MTNQLTLNKIRDAALLEAATYADINQKVKAVDPTSMTVDQYQTAVNDAAAEAIDFYNNNLQDTTEQDITAAQTQEILAKYDVVKTMDNGSVAAIAWQLKGTTQIYVTADGLDFGKEGIEKKEEGKADIVRYLGPQSNYDYESKNSKDLKAFYQDLKTEGIINETNKAVAIGHSGGFMEQNSVALDQETAPLISEIIGLNGFAHRDLRNNNGVIEEQTYDSAGHETGWKDTGLRSDIPITNLRVNGDIYGEYNGNGIASDTYKVDEPLGVDTGLEAHKIASAIKRIEELIASEGGETTLGNVPQTIDPITAFVDGIKGFLKAFAGSSTDVNIDKDSSINNGAQPDAANLQLPGYINGSDFFSSGGNDSATAIQIGTENFPGSITGSYASDPSVTPVTDDPLSGIFVDPDTGEISIGHFPGDADDNGEDDGLDTSTPYFQGLFGDFYDLDSGGKIFGSSDNDILLGGSGNDQLTESFDPNNCFDFSVFETTETTACFAAGTGVRMADGSVRAIETLLVDDLVIAFDGAGDLESRRVTQTFVHENRAVFQVNGNGPGNNVLATGEHPFLRADGAFIELKDLSPGDRIVRDDGRDETFAGRDPVPGQRTVYNIEVEGLHTYVAEGYRVHN